MIELDEFVTIKEAAKTPGVLLNSLRNWHRDGRMTAYGNPVTLADLQHWVTTGDGVCAAKEPSATGTACIAPLISQPAGMAVMIAPPDSR